MRLGQAWQIFACQGCGSWFYDPPPPPEEGHAAADPIVLRWYVGQGANLSAAPAHLGPLLERGAHAPGRLLDIGCSFGFALDFARRLYGWQVQGIDPAPYAALGAAELGLPIIQGLLRPGDVLPVGGFDIVAAAQVIEHVADPAGFVALLAAHLAPPGVLALTTPAVEDIAAGAANAAEREGLLGPGTHVVLFSAAALDGLLRAAGFAHVSVRRVDCQLLAYASQAPLDLPAVDAPALLRRYLERAAAELPAGGMLQQAMLGRLFIDRVDHGDYAEAAALLPELPDFAAARCDGLANGHDYLARFPANAASLAFRQGMLALNHQADAGRAIACFATAAALCAARLGYDNLDHIEEASLLWQARSHHAFACLVAGDYAGCTRGTRRIIAAPADVAPPLDAALREKAAAMLAQVPRFWRLRRWVHRVAQR